MSNPTSNFNWQMPTATDLVTDLPADFEVFGQAVDTSLADLRGGTTGQVLAKASNTDMDFSWTAIDPLVILDAKGDLITATAADTPARLAVGTNNQVLTVDSSTSTGLKWATPAGGGKVLQVVAASYSTETQNNTSTYADTGLTATITPTSATSKILVLMTQNGVAKSGDTSVNLKLLRAGTDIAQIGVLLLSTSSALYQEGNANISYLDDPATTSATTYKTQFRSSAGISFTRVQNNSSVSSIVLLEIGA